MANQTAIQIIDGQVKRETAKAVLLDVTYDGALGLKGVELWFPKSQISIEGNAIFATDWIVEQKNDELAGRVRSFYGILTADRGKEISEDSMFDDIMAEC